VASVKEVRLVAEALASRRARAAAQLERSFGAAISARAHEATLDAWREAPDLEAGETDALATQLAPSRGVAAAVGTAVHGALERLDLSGDLARGLAEQAERLEDEIVRGLAARERPAALARAGELLERFAGGPLMQRLSAIASHVLARELPVLLPPQAVGDGAPTGYLAGVVDLLYRDPDTGLLVVADYKTDRIEADEALAESSARYARQGEGYVRAVQQALALPTPPRFELWYLDLDRIEQTALD